jgi:excisionase family DNA binding protein
MPVAEAAEIAGVSERTVWRLLKAGRLKRYQRGLDSRTFVDRRQLERLLKLRAV